MSQYSTNLCHCVHDVEDFGNIVTVGCQGESITIFAKAIGSN